MMQIYIDAICQSRIGDTQYVLQYGLTMERTSQKDRLLQLLKSGWNIKGKFINGDGYETYTVENDSDIKVLRNFLQNKLNYNIEEKYNKILLSFQEFYNRDCKTEGSNVGITLWSVSSGEHENLRFENEEAEEIRNILKLHLNISQDRDMLINLLERENKK